MAKRESRAIRKIARANSPMRGSIVIHEKARLGILTSLMTHPDGLLFNDLKELCSLTDGNLNRHLKTLVEAGLVEVWKGFKNNYPQTLCRITQTVRSDF